MNLKKKIATGLLIGATILAIPLWLLSYPETTFRHNLKPWFIYSSQLAGILGFVLYTLSLMLSTRWERLEDFFGGLDKVYQIHHTIGKSAFFLLLLHPLLLAARWIPEDIIKAAEYVLPLHRRLAINLGSWALIVLIVSMLVTLVIKIPYDKWKIAHKLTGVAFILAVAHMFLLEELVTANPALAIYLGLFSALGIFSYLYKSVLYNYVSNKKSFTVQKVDRLNSQVMEITLTPDDHPLQFVPGQFCFFSYSDGSISRESHPFTICSSPDESHITIIVKALGDYTNKLYKMLEPGTPAAVEGPYGRFNYKKHSHPQVWIAGGVGIAPFISWIEDLEQTNIPQDFQAELYYGVNNGDEAVHLQKFRNLEKQLSGFSFHLIPEDRKGFLSAKDIPDLTSKEIFICGPAGMRQSLLNEFQKLRVDSRNVHFEDFDFFGTSS